MLERIIDIAAASSGIDPVEIRRRNLIAARRFPLTTVTGANYDVGDYAQALDEALRVAGYDELRARAGGAARRAATPCSSASASPPTSRSPPAGRSRSSDRSRCTTTAR